MPRCLLSGGRGRAVATAGRWPETARARGCVFGPMITVNSRLCGDYGNKHLGHQRLPGVVVVRVRTRS